MSFIINERNYNSSFDKSEKGFQHNKGDLIKLFPFATDTTSLSESTSDLISFRGITGDFFRTCKKISFKNQIKKEDLLNSIVNSVETEYMPDLKNLVAEVFYDQADHLVLFDAAILKHLNFELPNAKLKNLQSYISNLLIDDEVKDIINSAFVEHKSKNILYDLILNQLNQLSEKETIFLDKKGTYEGRIALEIRELFKKDLRQLSKYEIFFVENISILIRYYYFQYIVRLTAQLNLIFIDEKKTAPLFFSLDWEKLSRSRFCLENGWFKLENSLESIFAHTNCLELVNTIDGNEGCFSLETPFTYEEILHTVKNLSEDSEKDLTLIIHKLINRYKENIVKVSQQGFTWDDFENHYKSPQNEIYLKYHSLNLIYKLFHLVKYQFENTGRNRPYKDYNTWFKTFVKINYIKLRGSLGSTLKIDRKLLLLLTELSISSSEDEKILVTKLWTDLETRGLYLDHESKKEVKSFFEKINVLEKKSDSGDAQYVKSLLTK